MRSSPPKAKCIVFRCELRACCWSLNNSEEFRDRFLVRRLYIPNLINLIWSIVDKSSTCRKAIFDDRHSPLHRQSDQTLRQTRRRRSVIAGSKSWRYIRLSGSQWSREVDDYTHGF